MSNQTVHFKDIREKIIETLITANKEVLIAVAWFTDDQIIDVLNNLCSKGISISVIFYDDKINNKDLFKTLYYSKAELKVSKKLMHNKFCIIDREIVINGSYNWTYNAAKNDENIQITRYNYDLVNTFVEQFFKLKENCKNFDNHFNYSLNNLKDEDILFEKYYKNIEETYKIPFIYYLEPVYILIGYKKTKKFEGYCVITNQKEKRDFFQLKYFLDKKFKINEIETLFNKKFIIPKLYSFVNKNIDISTHFTEDKLLVIEDGRHVYFINNKNEVISEKIQIISIKNNNYFQISNQVFCDVNLNIINFDFNSSHAFIDGVGIVASKEKQKYTLYDFDGKRLLQNSYDTYHICKNTNNIEFIEFPQLCVSKAGIIHKLRLDYKYFSINSRGSDFPYKFFVIGKDKKISNGKCMNSNAEKYIYCSDFDYKYSDFIIQFKNRMYLHKYASLDVNKYIQLRDNFYNHSLKNKINYFSYIETEEQKSKECYIATMVYEDINHPKVETLRKFRDTKLNKSTVGRLFIKFYYAYSPSAVEKLQNHKNINYLIKKILDLLLTIIN